MKHCIIVKFKESVEDKAALTGKVKELFAGCEKPAGVSGCRVIGNCIDRPNRSDLMIVVDMPREALPAWDTSELHLRWKSDFGEFIAAKAIFDFE